MERRQAKQRLDIYPTDELVEKLDRWRARRLPILSRAEAVRRIVEMTLKEDEEKKDAKDSR